MVATLGLVLLDIAIVVAVARALRVVLDRVRQPPVMAEVLAGLVLGASLLGTLPGDPTGALFPADARDVLTVLGQVALAGYVFTVGAHLDLGALKAERGVVLAVAAGSFAVPFVAGAALALAVHDGVAADPDLVPFALFLGTAFAVTAFPVLARIVEARGLQEHLAGRVALASAAAQELLVWPLLAVAVALGGTGGGDERGPAATLLLSAAALAGVALLARAVLPAVLRRWPRAAGPAVLAALAAAALATDRAGLHVVLGAFLLGLALPARLREAGATILQTRPLVVLSALLLPVSFALPALRVDVWALGGDGLALLATVLAVAVAAKLGSATVAARATGVPPREALAVGTLMNARGLVELVVLSVGLQQGLIDQRLFSVMVLMALATTFATGPLVARLTSAGEDRRRAGRRSWAAVGSRP